MSGAGSALMGIGYSAAPDGRAREAAERALRSPLIDTEIVGARGILLSIAVGDDLTLLEVNEAAEVVRHERPTTEHHLRCDRRRAAHRAGVGHRRRDGDRHRPPSSYTPSFPSPTTTASSTAGPGAKLSERESELPSFLR